MRYGSVILAAAMAMGCNREAVIDLTEENEDLRADLGDSWTQIDELRDELALLKEQVGKLEENRIIADDIADIVRVITADTTWTITTEEGFDDAIAALDKYRIGASATLTIQIAPGEYHFDHPLTFRHPDGGRIEVVGDNEDPGSVELHFAASDGVVVEEGSTLGYLGGLSLYGDNATALTDGLTVQNGSVATIGPLVISSFLDNGLKVVNGSFLRCEEAACAAEELGWLSVTGGDSGVSIDGRSGAYLPWMEVMDATGSGVVVSGGSTLNADYAVSGSHAGHGFYVIEGSWARLNESQATTNDGYGYLATGGSGIGAASAEAIGNAGYGFAASDHAYLAATNSQALGNTYGGYEATTHSYVEARYTNSSGGIAYTQSMNGFIRALALGDATVSYSSNDTGDLILGP